MDSRRGALTGLHIVVVEDNEDAREILRSLLGYFGASITAATGASEGLEFLGHVAPDVVVTDVRLGDQDATWLLREARKIGCHAPFIAVSGLDVDEQALSASGFAVLAVARR